MGPKEADAILKVSLVDVTQNPLRYNRDRTKSAEEYRLLIKAVVVVERTADGKRLIDNRKIQGQATFEFVGDMNSSKRGAIPLAARDLAHDIVECIVEYW